MLGEALTSIASFYRDVLTVRSGGTEAASNIDLLNEIEWWASGGVEDRNLVSAMERCVEARAGLIRNANVVLGDRGHPDRAVRARPTARRGGGRDAARLVPTSRL